MQKDKTLGQKILDFIADFVAQIKRVVSAYEGSGLSADEIWEEVICDSLGDMNIFANDEVRGEIVGDFLSKLKDDVQRNTKPARAPPSSGKVEGKYSFDNTSQELIDFVDSLANAKTYSAGGDVREIGRKIRFAGYDDGFYDDFEEGIYALYANTDNHLIIDTGGSSWDNIVSDDLPVSENSWTTHSVAAYAKEKGYSGITFKNLKDNSHLTGVAAANITNAATVYAFFDAQSQVKSADAVTYDENNNVIPLSERFKKDNTDLRFSDRYQAP